MVCPSIPSMRQWSKYVGAQQDATAASTSFTEPVVRAFLLLSLTKNQLCPFIAVAEIIIRSGLSLMAHGAARPRTEISTSRRWFGLYIKPSARRLAVARAPVGVKIS